VILYGSVARRAAKPESDIDLLILVEKARLTYHDKTKLSNPLYEIEFETGQIISSLILSRDDWESRHKITPFYENVTREGIKL
jgi:predicted nucleotidyltransferase